jgi:hypothetical protein
MTTAGVTISNHDRSGQPDTHRHRNPDGDHEEPQDIAENHAQNVPAKAPDMKK